MKIINKTKNAVIAENAEVARSHFARMKGLLGKKNISPGQALIIERCNSIHTFFMQFPIDVLFVDRNNKIVGMLSCIKPWRLSPILFKASFVVELPAGTIQSLSIQKDDIVSL